MCESRPMSDEHKPAIEDRRVTDTAQVPLKTYTHIPITRRPYLDSWPLEDVVDTGEVRQLALDVSLDKHALHL